MKRKRMKQYLWVVAAAYLMSGCSISPEVPPRTPLYQASQSDKKVVFSQTLHSIGDSTKEDPNYQKIALDTAKKKIWFKALCYKLWDRQITKDQFITQGLKVYPDHQYEFEFIAEGFNLQGDIR